MNDQTHSAPPGPPARRDRLPSWLAWLLLGTGPLAWYIQLNVGFMMASWPCYPNMERRRAPLTGYGWTHPATVVIMVLCVAVACAAGFAAWAKLRLLRENRGGDHAELIEIGHGRTLFLALWATILGLGSAFTTLATLVAFLLVPPCLG